jgi:hypothetical protein
VYKFTTTLPDKPAKKPEKPAKNLRNLPESWAVRRRFVNISGVIVIVSGMFSRKGARSAKGQSF